MRGEEHHGERWSVRDKVTERGGFWIEAVAASSHTDRKWSRACDNEAHENAYAAGCSHLGIVAKPRHRHPQ